MACCLEGLETNSSVDDGVTGAEAPEIAELVLEAENPLARPWRLGGGGGGGGTFEFEGKASTEFVSRLKIPFLEPGLDGSGDTTIGLGLM